MRYQAIIFDLDGVICRTDQYHYLAWKQVADELGIPFDEQVNERLRGVSRMASFDIILERYNGTMSDEEKIHWTDKKNEIYKSMLTQMGPDDMLEGVADTLHKLRAMELDLAIGSSAGTRNSSLASWDCRISSMPFQTVRTLPIPSPTPKCSSRRPNF